MVITCEECSTRFNLDESLLKKGGSKVRCCRCGHVFTAFPPQAPPILDDMVSKKESPQEDHDPLQEKINPEIFAKPKPDSSSLENNPDNELDLGFSADPDDLNELELDDLDLDDDLDLNDDLELNDDIDLENELEEYDDLEDSEPDPISTDSELDIGLDLDMDFDQGLDRNTEESQQEVDINLSKFDEILEAGENGLELESPEESDLDDSFDDIFEDTLEDAINGTDKSTGTHGMGDDVISEKDLESQSTNSKKAETPDLLSIIDEGDETSITPPRLDYNLNEPFKEPKKPGKTIIIILLTAILILMAYSACIFYGVKIPYISTAKIPLLSELLTPEPPAPVSINLAPDKQSVNGRFLTNKISGTLFVITGTVTNTSSQTLSKIKVRGTLITTDKVKATTKIVPCGNIIDEDQLKDLEMNQINTMQAKETGNNLSNAAIQPDRSIPFMVVFSDLPENLENFTVNVEDFEIKSKEN